MSPEIQSTKQTFSPGDGETNFTCSAWILGHAASRSADRKDPGVRFWVFLYGLLGNCDDREKAQGGVRLGFRA